MLLMNGKDGELVVLADVGTATLEDVKSSRVPALPSVKMVKPIALTFLENHAGVFLQTSDGSIHVVSFQQAQGLKLFDLKLPLIDITGV